MPDIVKNRKVKHDYEILDLFECGISLRGTEVKSIREGNVNLRDAFGKVDKGELWLWGCDIMPYGFASHVQHEAKRARRLLVHRKEYERIEKEVTLKRLALPATRMYWKGSLVKVEIAIARGKANKDRRQSLKEAVEDREAGREMARFNRGM